MTTEFLYEFIRQHNLAVVSSVAPSGKPESALVGVAVSKNLDLVFDTVKNSRKYKNIIRHPNVSVVIGWNNETTLQYEGTAEELNGADADEFREIYFNVFPEGRERMEKWEGLVHFRIRPRWIRYSDFNEPQQIEEISFE